MKVETFYWIISDNGKIHSSKYSQNELQIAKNQQLEMTKRNSGTKFHLMKRVTSTIANDILFEDSE